MCDLATQDDGIIRDHAKNTAVIGGRYRTLFRTAFMVRTPIEAQRITDVKLIDADPPLPSSEITLDMVRNIVPRSN
jgi:hypothetical protein